MLFQITRAVLGATLGETGRGPAAGAPSNQQIIDSAQSAYSQHQPAVDAMTLALVNIINTGSEKTVITTLDTLNWSSPGISPAVVEDLYEAHDVTSAIGVCRQDAALKSYSIGVFSGQLPGQTIGMVGFDRDLVGTNVAGTMLTLDLYNKSVTPVLGSNLQFGVWLSPAGALHDHVIGLFIATSVQNVAINLKILLTQTLLPYGFVVSSGAVVNIPVNTAVFAGSTANWP